MDSLLILIGIALAVLLGRQWFRAYSRARLLNKPPELRRFLVKLPYGEFTDTNERMAKWYAQTAPHLEASASERRRGERFLELTVAISRAEGAAQPTLAFMVGCPPEMVQMVKKTLRQRFGGNASFQEPKAGEDLLVALRSAAYPAEQEVPAPVGDSSAGLLGTTAGAA
jgi:hypothetical protein